MHALADARQLACAQVLAGVGGGGVSVGDGGDFQHAVQLVGGGVTGDERNAQDIDDRLQNHAAHADERVLRRDRNAQRHQPAADLPVRLQILAGGTDEVHLAQPVQAEQAGADLRDNRRNARADNAPVKACDEQKIQRDIHQRGDDHRIQRGFAVAQRAQNARQKVVAHDHREGGEQYREVRLRHGADFGGRAQQVQHPGNQRNRQSGQAHRADGGQHGGVADVFAQRLIIACAERLRDGNGKALRKVTVIKGSEACWLFVKLEKSANFDTFMEYAMERDWVQLKDDSGAAIEGVFFRAVAATDAASADAAYQVIANDTVTVKGNVTKEQLNDLTDATYPSLTITAYAVQQVGFEPEITEGATEPTLDQTNAAALKAWAVAQSDAADDSGTTNP